MSEQPSLLTQQRWTIFFGLLIALGPLMALTFGSKYADEETLARAESNDRTNAAFDALPDERRRALMQDPQALITLVSNHLMRTRLGITDLMQTNQINLLSGKSLALSAPGAILSVSGAEIVKSNLVAGNGVVHVVDGHIL